jgi:hypothetical protein
MRSSQRGSHQAWRPIIAAFIVSSAYYVAATPLERRAVGAAALDRGGRPEQWQVLTEVLRTAVVAAAFAWIAHRTRDLGVSHALVLALIIWVGFPLVLLAGSVIGEKVHPATATMHAGDWLLKLLLIAILIGLIH